MAVADEGFGDGFPEAVDIEGFAGGEVADGGDGLRGALEVRAAPCDETFLLGDGRLAGRAFPCDEIVEGKGRDRGIRIDDLDDGGDDLARFLDEDFRADVDAFFGDLVLVVQGGAGDGGAGNQDGIELGDGGQHAGAADLDGDVAEDGFLLLGEELVGGGPARGAGGVAELFALGAVEDFHDDPVGGVVDVMPVSAEEFHPCEEFVEVAGDADGLVARDGEAFQQMVEIGFGIERFAIISAEAVGEERERAGGDDLGIELLEGSGGGVAGVGEGGQAGFVALLVHGGEGGVRHEDLAADFQNGWKIQPRMNANGRE